MSHLYPMPTAYLPWVSMMAWVKSDLRYISHVIFYKVRGDKRKSMKKKKNRETTGNLSLGKKKQEGKFNYTVLIINY